MEWKSVYDQPPAVKTVLKLFDYSAQEINETKATSTATNEIKSTAIGVDGCALCACACACVQFTPEYKHKYIHLSIRHIKQTLGVYLWHKYFMIHFEPHKYIFSFVLVLSEVFGWAWASKTSK